MTLVEILLSTVGVSYRVCEYANWYSQYSDYVVLKKIGEEILTGKSPKEFQEFIQEIANDSSQNHS